MFFQQLKIPYLTRNSTFAGVVLASDEGKYIAAALGNKKAVLLGNHGLLTASRSIEETVAYFVLLDKCCEVQLAADASSAGTGKPLVLIGKAEAQSTWEAVGTKENGYCKFRAMYGYCTSTDKLQFKDFHSFRQWSTN